MRATLRRKGQLTIPTPIRRAAHLEEGDVIVFEVTPDGIVLKPRKVIDATQARLWTPEWQAKEREADEDIEAGRVRRFDSDPEFLNRGRPPSSLP